MKKLFILLNLIIFTLCIHAVDKATAKVVSASTASGKPGEQVSIDISIDNWTGVAGGDITLTYDATKLSVVSEPQKYPAFGLNVVPNKDIPGKVIFTMAGYPGLPGGSGAIVNIIFKIADNAPRGITIPLPFDEAQLYNEDGNNIPTTSTPGEIIIILPEVTVSRVIDFGGGSTSPGTENVRFLQLGVTTDSGRATITAVKAKFTGTSSATNSDISAFDVYEDTDGDGNIDSGSNPLGTVSSPDLTNGATVTGLSFDVTTTTKYLLLVLDIAGDASPSHTAGLELTDASFITSDRTVAPTNFPIRNTSDTSLPVELSSFTATASDGQVTLRWVTQTEVNNIGFAIYRSEQEDGKYTRVAFVNGAGNSGMPTDYQFTDKKAEAGKTYFYCLEDIDIAGERSKSDIIKVVVPSAKFIPKEFRLLQNYPNPFNPETWIPFDLATDAIVTIRIYDVNGLLVRQLDIGNQKAGRYLDRKNAAYWNGKDQLGQSVSSGLYFYTLKAGDFVATRRMVILK
jgi:hypothetical protein